MHRNASAGVAAVLGHNRKLVQRHMREMGIAGIVPGPNTSQRAAEHRVFPYLLRHITASYPNHFFGIDITYIRLLHGWVYLVAVLDWPQVPLRARLGVVRHALLQASLSGSNTGHCGRTIWRLFRLPD